MTTKVSIISEAYTLLGQNGINDIATGNPREAYVSSIYDRLYPSILSIRNWSFALQHQTMAQLESPLDLDEWAYGYQMPTDPLLLRVYRVYPNTDFHIYGNKIYTNASTLSIDYVGQIDESLLPMYFVSFLTYTLCAKIAMLVTQQPSLVQLWNEEARTAFLLASSIDSQNQPNRPVSDSPFYNSKFIGGYTG